MKTFEQLTPTEQAKAIEICTNSLLTAICEGAVRFNDELNHDALQARIDAAAAEAERMSTPWFIGEYVMAACRDEIEGMARCDAENALYPLPGEHCIAGIVAD